MRKINQIILVDDEPVMNIINSKVVEVSGVCDNVKAFECPREALNYLSDINITEGILLLLDINMPYLNGFEFVNAARNLIRQANIYICILTSSIDPKDEARATQDEQIHDFQSKPLSVDQLKSIIGKCNE